MSVSDWKVSDESLIYLVGEKNYHFLTFLEQELGTPIYLVGGCVRDFFLKKIPNDIDIIADISAKEFEEILRGIIPFSAKVYSFGKKDTIAFRLKGSYLPVEFSPFSKITLDTDPFVLRADSLIEDLGHRDFTINSVAIEFSSKIVIDPFDGLEDVRRKRIDCAGSAIMRLLEDPFRALRALDYEARYKPAYITESLSDAIFNIRTEFYQKVCPEQIVPVFNEIFENGDPNYIKRFFISLLGHQYFFQNSLVRLGPIPLDKLLYQVLEDLANTDIHAISMDKFVAICWGIILTGGNFTQEFMQHMGIGALALNKDYVKASRDIRSFGVLLSTIADVDFCAFDPTKLPLSLYRYFLDNLSLLDGYMLQTIGEAIWDDFPKDLLSNNPRLEEPPVVDGTDALEKFPHDPSERGEWLEKALRYQMDRPLDESTDIFYLRFMEQEGLL